MYPDMELKCPSGTKASLKNTIIPNIDETNDENNDKTNDENIDQPNVITKDKNNKYINDKSSGENKSLPTAVIKSPTILINNNHDHKSPVTEEPVSEGVSPEKPISKVISPEEPISEATSPEELVREVSPEKPILPVEYVTGRDEMILVEPSTYTRNCLWLLTKPASAHRNNFESIPKPVPLIKL